MSEPPSQPPEAHAAPILIADRLQDFNDRLSPMLVKELRQGLRAKTFVVVFLLLQGLLGLVMLTSIAGNADPARAGTAITRTVFLFYSLALLVIQPIRGIGALHREIDANTIELMVLTRLSAWRIVLGKWLSIASQSALIFTAVLPYLVLRYWFGEMNLVGELSLLLLVLLASCALTAVVIGISAIPSVIVRGLIPLILLGGSAMPLCGFVLNRDFDDLVAFCSFESTGDFQALLFSIGFGGYMSWITLGVGASMIAPSAENHSTARRLVTIGLLVLALIPAVFMTSLTGADRAILFILLIAPVVFLSLTERFDLLPPHCAPFVRRGRAGKVMGRLLYPGWPTAVLFSFVVFGLGLAIYALAPNRNLDLGARSVVLSLLSSIIFPAALLSLLGRRIEQRFIQSILILIANAVVVCVLAMIAGALSTGQRGFLWVFSWLPGVGLIQNGFPKDFSPTSVYVTNIGVFLGYSLILLITALLKFREIRKVEASVPAS